MRGASIDIVLLLIIEASQLMLLGWALGQVKRNIQRDKASQWHWQPDRPNSTRPRRTP